MRGIFAMTCVVVLLGLGAGASGASPEWPPAPLMPNGLPLTAPENLPPRPSKDPAWRRMTNFGADTDSSCNGRTHTLLCFVEAHFACAVKRDRATCGADRVPPERALVVPEIYDYRIVAVGPPWTHTDGTLAPVTHGHPEAAVAVELRSCQIMDAQDVETYEETGGWQFFAQFDANGNRWACQNRDNSAAHYLYLRHADDRWMSRAPDSQLGPDEYPPRPKGNGWRRLTYFGLGDTDCLNKRHTRRCALETYIYRHILLFDERYKYEQIIDYRLASIRPYRIHDIPKKWRPQSRRDLREELRGIAPHPSELGKDARLAMLVVRTCHRSKHESAIICGHGRPAAAIIADDGHGILDGRRIDYWSVEWFEYITMGTGTRQRD